MDCDERDEFEELWEAFLEDEHRGAVACRLGEFLGAHEARQVVEESASSPRAK
jgi:hypothetical protein